MRRITRALAAGTVAADLASPDRDGVLRELTALLFPPGSGREVDGAVAALVLRESQESTGIGGGVAIPHARLKGRRETMLAVGRCRKGVDFKAVDGRPVDIVFLLLAPEDAAGEHLRVLAGIARLAKDQAFCRALRTAGTPGEIVALVTAVEEDSNYY